jgi:hypothetical protein
MSSPEIPEEFVKIIRDFTEDLKNTFPEYVPCIEKWWKTKESFNHIEEEEDRIKLYEKAEKKSIKLVFDFCRKKLPPRFFEILYQNDEMFKEDSNVDTEFLPRLHFKNLWNCDISEKTRETLWKYLQLLLFSIVGTLDDKNMLGDSAKLFEAISGEDFKGKLSEVMKQIETLFDASNSNLTEGLPNAEEINEHMSGILDGKIGQIAREIAEETANELNLDTAMGGVTDMKDAFTLLMKNPSKMMSIMKNVSDKLDSKLKSGELKESEMIEEATEIMNKMKNIPGMGNIQSLVSQMGLGNLGKIDTNAMNAKLNQKMKMAKTKERIRAKAEANAKAKALEKLMAEKNKNTTTLPKNALSEDELVKLFNKAEKIEKTPRDLKKKKK